MTTDIIRERLHEYIRFADDKKVNAIYTMVENEIVEELDLWEDEDFLNELNDRLEKFESGETKSVSVEQVMYNAEKRLKL
ncbi:MAG: hypothetical protein M3O71_25090 [Bacteroidota bacterium]|nr:hypothetical protein [Bacteroidota bacterium]